MLLKLAKIYKYLMIATLGISSSGETYQVIDPQIASYYFAIP